MARKKKKKIKGCIQGRKLRGKKQLLTLSKGCFAYGGLVYDIDDFPPGDTINLDSTTVEPIGEYEGKKKKRKKRKGGKRKYAESSIAWLYSNMGDCPDVQRLFKGQ